MEGDGGGDPACNELVRRVNDTIGATYCCEGIGEEIKVTFGAFRALINDLLMISNKSN